MGRRSKAPYTESEIAAWDDGFATAIQVARSELINHLEGFKTPADAALAIRNVEAGMREWLEYQQEKDQ